jgi:hypothetical protein
MDPATITLAATTVAGIIWAVIERRAKNISKKELGQLEDQLLDAAPDGYTKDEIFDFIKSVVKYSRDTEDETEEE